MYRFDKPIKHIVRTAKALAKEVETDRLLSSQTRSINYPIFIGNVSYPIGNLKITSGVSENYGPAYIHVIAELNDDRGRNNTVPADDTTTEAITFAIGFTCGAAMFRSAQYRNQ